jgi:hypothetical protein
MTGTKNTNNEPQHKRTKWATFTYSRKETKQITKLFKVTHKNSLQNTEHDTETEKNNTHNQRNTTTAAFTIQNAWTAH